VVVVVVASSIGEGCSPRILDSDDIMGGYCGLMVLYRSE